MKLTNWILLTLSLAAGLKGHAETLRGFEQALQVDEQLEEFEEGDRSLYNKAMSLVQGSSLAKSPRGPVAVFVTTKYSDWTRNALEDSGFVLPPGTPSATARVPTKSGKEVDTVIVFWERILAAEDPLPVLTISLAREIYGSIFIMNNSTDNSESGVVADNIFVYKTVIKFVRELQGQPAFASLRPYERDAFDEYLQSLKEELREWRRIGQQTGVCEAMLISEDN